MAPKRRIKIILAQLCVFDETLDYCLIKVACRSLFIVGSSFVMLNTAR